MHLTTNAIQYVLFHLNHHWNCIPQVVDSYRFVQEHTCYNLSDKPAIVFPLSELEVPNSTTIRILDTDVPLLFPGTLGNSNYYTIEENGNLIFHHDFLSSVFYLLAGVQEKSGNRDEHGRYRYQYSVQCQLGCADLPLVNYYFEAILSGIEAFCKFHSLPFKRKRLFDRFGFLLSHDVDRISFYHPREVFFKAKQLLGLSSLNYSYIRTCMLFIKGIVHLISPFRKQDPWWNFDYLIDLEKKLGIKSSWYFLDKEHKNKDSRYRFSDKAIADLMKQLWEQGCEVGLHATYYAADNQDSLMRQRDEFEKATGRHPVGVRQHFLRVTGLETFRNQEAAGLKYDTSLAFAEHEGYRNGYCYPFKLYDLENDREMDVWEIPLTLMEVSVLNYRKAGLAGLETAANKLMDEADKFGGIFSLLWHNCRLTDDEYPGVTDFYPHLLKVIMQRNPDSVTGEMLLEKVED